MNIFNGTCRFCGSIRPIMSESQEEADNIITNTCDCGAASIMQKKEKLAENIEYICDGHNPSFRALPPQTVEIIKNMAIRVFENDFMAITIELIDRKIKIYIGKEEKTIIKLTASRQETAEA